MAHKPTKESGNKIDTSRLKVAVQPAAAVDDQLNVSEPLDDVEEVGYVSEDDEDSDQRNFIPVPITLKLSRSLLRKLNDNAREEGVTVEELAAELVAEGVVLRAWEIVEKKAAMRGGNANGNNQGNFNRQGNVPNGNQSHGGNNHNNHQRPFQGPGNKMAQKKLQRQARQHANAMDLMSDKAAFLEYVRNQEKKRR